VNNVVSESSHGPLDLEGRGQARACAVAAT